MFVFRKTVVQECEGGLQPAAQTGKQTGTTCQTWRPGKSHGLKPKGMKQPEGTQQNTESDAGCVSRCPCHSSALARLHTWPKEGADVSASAPDVVIFSSLLEASLPAQLQTFRLSVRLWVISAGWVCFNGCTACLMWLFIVWLTVLRARLL